jgi:hypothetical protein
MHLKKFALLYSLVLVLGLFILSFNDILFIYSAESQTAKVTHFAPAKSAIFYKMSGSYEEKSLLSPAIDYQVGGKLYTHVPKYSCKDGCHSIGSDITIFYKKDKPDEVLVSSFGDMWKYKIYFLIVMFVLLLTALPYIYYNSNKQPSSGSNG